MFVPCSRSFCVSIFKLSFSEILLSDSIRMAAPSGSGIPVVEYRSTASKQYHLIDRKIKFPIVIISVEELLSDISS